MITPSMMADRKLQPQPDDVPRSDAGPFVGTAGRVRVHERRRQSRSGVLHERDRAESALELQDRGIRRPAVAVSRRDGHRPELSLHQSVRGRRTRRTGTARGCGARPRSHWGSRVTNAPPGTPYPGYFQSGGTFDLSLSVTKVIGRHTVKAGYYYQYELHNRNGGSGNWNGSLSFAQDTVGLNPFDTSFGFANAAIGTFSSYTQVSKYLAGKFIYHQNDFYMQDNWKVNGRLTLDYGVRFVNQRPVPRRTAAAGQLPRGPLAGAGVARCSTRPAARTACIPCSGTNRQAMNPMTGQFLGPNSAIAIGTHRAELRQHDQWAHRRRRGHLRATAMSGRRLRPRRDSAWRTTWTAGSASSFAAVPGCTTIGPARTRPARTT